MAPLIGFYAPLSACRSQRQIEHKEFFSHSLTARTCGHRYRSRRNRSVIRMSYYQKLWIDDGMKRAA
jgi:hypothetical protein